MSKSIVKRDAAGKITAVMEFLCSSGKTHSLREIETHTGIPRSTLHRLLLSLERQEWVYRDGQSERFRPGVRFFLLHNSKLFHRALVRAAAPQMERLVQETGKTAVLSVLEGSTGLCVHHVEPKRGVKYVAHRGMTIPLYAGATGKVLLAFCPEEERERFLASGLPGDVDSMKLREEIENIRCKGYAYSREEWMENAGDISVPVFDGHGKFVAQLGLAGLVTSFNGQEEVLLRSLKEAAGRIGENF
ncbi:MAG: IclR family transcriptional regulator [Thermovirgaceae bacterium]